MTRLNVSAPGGRYPVIIGDGVLSDSPELKSLCRDRTVVVVTDGNVHRLYGSMLFDVISRYAAAAHEILLEPGEQSKNMLVLQQLYSEFYRAGLNRSGVVIAFGGGVTGDLAGFAAATYMRGVTYVQVPTTLLAQVDSSVGGKVAVNLDEGKNLVGAFYQPALVLADTGFLRTLPSREFRAGMAEVVKYAAIGEPELAAVLRSERFDIERVVYLCCKLKSWFVERDERDNSVRMTLNFGHTFGHAIERLYAFERYNHGEAVAMGMQLAVRTGIMLGVTAPETEDQLAELLNTHGLSARFDGSVADLVLFMLGDKKNTDGGVTLILLRSFGEPLRHVAAGAEIAGIWSGADE